MNMNLILALLVSTSPTAFAQEHLPMFALGLKGDMDSEIAPPECAQDERAFLQGRMASLMETYTRMFFNDDTITIAKEELIMIDTSPINPLAFEDFNTYEMLKFDQDAEAEEVIVKSTGTRGLMAKGRTINKNVVANTAAKDQRDLAEWYTVGTGAFKWAYGGLGWCRFCLSDSIDQRRRNVRALSDETETGQKGWLVSGLETLLTYGMTYSLPSEYRDWLVQNNIEYGCLGDGKNLTVVFELWV